MFDYHAATRSSKWGFDLRHEIHQNMVKAVMEIWVYFTVYANKKVQRSANLMLDFNIKLGEMP